MSVSGCSRASRRSRAAARSRPRPSATLKSTRSARCWTKTCSAARSRATECWRRSASSRSSGSTRQPTPPSSVAAMPSTSSPSRSRRNRSSCGAISATSSTGSRPTTTTSAPRWLLDRDPENALNLAHARRSWYTRGHVRDETGSSRCSKARRRAERHAWSTRLGGVSLERAPGARGLWKTPLPAPARPTPPPRSRSRSATSIALADGDIAVLEDALAIAEQAGDPFVLGTALNNLGVESAERGNTWDARELFEESFRVRAEIGDLARMALSPATSPKRRSEPEI